MIRRPLRTFAYGHPWFYDLVTGISALPVGGSRRLRHLCAQQLAPRLPPQAAVLDLCCGGGAASAALLERGFRVTGLDCSRQALERAARTHPGLLTVQGLAEKPPLAPGQFAGVQISLALHEFPRPARLELLAAALGLLQPGGWFVALDLHLTHGPLGWPQQWFVRLFETDTAVDFLTSNLAADLTMVGYGSVIREILAMGSLQLVSARKPFLAPAP
ncbi:class I SAM-dependent methyltransferase [Candidatus Synechococcus spongiarum]|uniref:SAM-dependent methyltransferase sll0829 (UbiE paralog) n=1 Tax=Candidatus Synechococcus spongiarum TaxID=431041 RepID=A0A164Y0Z6_9SYNE|nr:class I SAM-dependent methyltransferase [Candidatus Synechococcus spongiarum]SAY38336.1 SAM-dependent methyltransferase sll0829 (UbiE paralog) [Candidatus Synechococcus spongiarum]